MTDAEFMLEYVARAREHSEYPAELDALEALAKLSCAYPQLCHSEREEALRKFRAAMEGK